MACSAVNRRTTTVTNVRAGRPNPASRRSTSRASSSWRRCATARSEPGRSRGRTRGEEGRRRPGEGDASSYPRVHARGVDELTDSTSRALETLDARHVRSLVPRVRRSPRIAATGTARISRAGAAGGDAVARQNKRRGGDGDGDGTKSRHPDTARTVSLTLSGAWTSRCADDGLRPTRAVAGRLREREPSRLPRATRT